MKIDILDSNGFNKITLENELAKNFYEKIKTLKTESIPIGGGEGLRIIGEGIKLYYNKKSLAVFIRYGDIIFIL